MIRMYKMLKGTLAMTVLLLLSAGPLFAQNAINVTGKVTDENGAPLAGVVVLVKDGGNNNATVTNTQGVYLRSRPPRPRRWFSRAWVIPAGRSGSARPTSWT